MARLDEMNNYQVFMPVGKDIYKVNMPAGKNIYKVFLPNNGVYLLENDTDMLLMESGDRLRLNG